MANRRTFLLHHHSLKRKRAKTNQPEVKEVSRDSQQGTRYCGSNMYCVICTSTVCKHFIGTNVILVTLCGIYLYLVQMKKSKAGQWWLSKLPETTKLNLHSSSLGQHRMSTTRVPLFKEIKCPTSSLIPKGSADHALLPTSTPLSEV